MHRYDDPLIAVFPCRFQGHAQPQLLSGIDFIVVRRPVLRRLRKLPASRPADSDVSRTVIIILQKNHIFVKRIELRRRRPPQIMIALKEKLPARKTMHPLKICFSVFQLQAPGKISRQDDHILRRDEPKPVISDFFIVFLPFRSEDIHRFV